MDFDDLDEVEASEVADIESSSNTLCHPSTANFVICDIYRPSDVDSHDEPKDSAPTPKQEPSEPEQVKVGCRFVRVVRETVDELEERLRNDMLPTRDITKLSQLKEKILDLAYLARDSHQRQRVVSAFAKLILEAVESKADDLCSEMCWQLCQMSFSLSFQDIDLYPGAKDGPVVLLAGYAGSHVDDIRPVAQRWSAYYGAAVMAMSPSSEWMADQNLAAFDLLMKLMDEGRALIIHVFSNGGLNPAKVLLTKWSTALQQQKANTPPLERLSCVILDSVALAGPADETDGVVSFADVGWGPGSWEHGVTQLYISLGLAMLLHYGTIESTATPIGLAWGRAVHTCMEKARPAVGMKRFPWTPFSALSEFWRRVPFLLIASSSDRIVLWEGTMQLAEELRRMPGRENLHSVLKDAGEDVLGKDGLGVHTLWIEEHNQAVAHAKHFKNHPLVYWEKVDHLASACLRYHTRRYNLFS